MRALVDAGQAVVSDDEGVVPVAGMFEGLLGRQDVAASIADVLEAEEVVEFVREKFGAREVSVIGYKWLRAVEQGKCTGFHSDSIYLRALLGDELHASAVSAWIPLGRVGPREGALVVAAGETYREKFEEPRVLGSDGTHSGWVRLTQEELTNGGGAFFSCEFEMGDVCIFDGSVIHCTAINQSNALRLSCDVRFLIDN